MGEEYQHFAIYSIDDQDPDLAADCTWMDQNPIAEYDPERDRKKRGAVFKTLGGVYVQDFGINVQDQRIFFSDRSAIQKVTRDALKTKYELQDGEWYFTPDKGANVWKVKFDPNIGFGTQLDVQLYMVGKQVSEPPPAEYEWYSYTIVLIVLEKTV